MVCRRPNTSKQASGQTIFLDRLRKLPVTLPNKVWATDISDILMACGFVYLVAVLDFFSRKVLTLKLSITMEILFCLEVVEDALA